MKLSRTLIVILLLSFGTRLSSTQLNAAEVPLGESVYKSISEAVFLLETVGDDGKIVGFGSAFLVADQKLVTNHHVIQGGTPFLKVGSVRIGCVVERVDDLNDLALLRIQGSITANPLTISKSEPIAGSTVFALGNPAGLERTITQGLLSGKRELNGRSLLQISASISPGSSGGPVVNDKGDVVGVAVGFLADGQNLNFAVPSSFVTDLIEGRSSSREGSLEKLLAKVAKLSEERSSLNLDETSSSQEMDRYSAMGDQITSLLRKAKELAAGSPDKLLAVAAAAIEAFEWDMTIDVARSAIQSSRKLLPEAHRLLAQALQASVLFLDKDETKRRLQEAALNARKLITASSKPRSEDLLLLAGILEDLPASQEESYSYYKRALDSARSEGQAYLLFYYRGLLRSSRNLKKTDEALSWLKAMVEGGLAEADDWALVARLLAQEERYAEAGITWLRVAALDPAAKNFCSAGASYWLADKPDEALAAYRKCIEKGALESDTETDLQNAYSSMSSILFDRGVYEESVKLAKQAIALDPEDGWAFLALSRSLNALGRNTEATVAAQNAIRVTDGKFSGMHFALGAAYFDLQNWDQAARAFQKAAELEPKDSASAYNVALCYQRQGFRADAALWYEEVLKRQPNHPEREDILRRIRVLRQ